MKKDLPHGKSQIITKLKLNKYYYDFFFEKSVCYTLKTANVRFWVQRYNKNQ